MRLLSGQIKESPSNRDGWSFGLTLRFGLEKIKFLTLGLFPKQLTIGITEAMISFELHDASMPDEDWSMDTPIQSSVEVSAEQHVEAVIDSTHEKSVNSETGSNLGAELSAAAKATIAATFKSNIANKATDKDGLKNIDIEKFNFTRHAILACGDHTAPSWLIKSVTNDDILMGAAIKSPYFARVKFTGNDPQLRLVANIPEYAITIQDSTGAFDHINKRIIGRRRISKQFCRTSIEIDKWDLKTIMESEKSSEE